MSTPSSKPKPQPQHERPQTTPEHVTIRRDDLVKLERQLIPLLNTIRNLLGKGPLGL